MDQSGLRRILGARTGSPHGPGSALGTNLDEAFCQDTLWDICDEIHGGLGLIPMYE